MKQAVPPLMHLPKGTYLVQQQQKKQAKGEIKRQSDTRARPNRTGSWCPNVPVIYFVGKEFIDFRSMCRLNYIRAVSRSGRR